MYEKQFSDNKEADYSEEYEKQITDLVKDIAKGNTDGYFVIVKTIDRGDTTVCEGFSRKRNCSKGIILETALANLGIPDEEIIKYLLLKGIKDSYGFYIGIRQTTTRCALQRIDWN